MERQYAIKAAYARKSAKSQDHTDQANKVTIYALELADGMFYVGKTKKTAAQRFQEHERGNGSAWTRLHKPIKIVESFAGDDDDENKYTLRYMREKGILKVRGGSFSQPWLDETAIAAINLLNNGAADLCFKCGAADHWVKACPLNNDSESSSEDMIVDMQPENIINFDANQQQREQIEAASQVIRQSLDSLPPEQRCCAVIIVVVIVILGLLIMAIFMTPRY